MTPPNSAPGCFAAASVFSHDSEVCRACASFEQCSEASLKTLESICAIIDVSDLMKRHAAARKLSSARRREEDKRIAAASPPGNREQPLSANPVQRKTSIEKVEYAISDDEQRIIAQLPVHPQRLAFSLCKVGYIDKVKKDLLEGRNTFATQGPQFLRVAVDQILSGGCTKTEMRLAFIAQLGHSENGAASHVSIMLSLFGAFKIAAIENGKIVVHPDLKP